MSNRRDPLGAEPTTHELPAERERYCPDVVRVGSRYRIRREGEALDDGPEIERLHNELADAHRRIAGLEEGARR